MNKPTKSHS